MKQCPQCRTTYTDDSLRYCLADGKELIQIDSEQETIAARRDQKLRVDIDRAEPVPPIPAPPKSRNSPALKILAIIALVGLLVIIGVGAVGTLIYLRTRNNSANTNKSVAVS